MPKTVPCPGQEGPLYLSDDAAGKTVRCPKCFATYQVPSTPEPNSEANPEEPANASSVSRSSAVDDQ